MSAPRSGAAASQVVVELEKAFAEAALPPPPIPSAFVADLHSLGPWCWATRDVDAAEMYLFGRYPEEVLMNEAIDHLAISHGGHGANSYFLTYQVVFHRLAIMTQTGFGGAYTDPERSRAAVSTMFSNIAFLLRRAASLTVQATSRWPRLVVFASERPLGAAGWLPRPCVGADERNDWLEANRCNPSEAFVKASELLQLR